MFSRRPRWHYGINPAVIKPSPASFPCSSRGIVTTEWRTLLLPKGEERMLEATFSPPPAPLTMPQQRTILGHGAAGNGIWGLQWACLLGKEHNRKLPVECTEPFPGWQACCRGQPERAIILWGGGNYSVLLMGFFLAVLRNGTVSLAWPWKGSHMAKRLCWSISHVSATPSAWNSPPSFFFLPRHTSGLSPELSSWLNFHSNSPNSLELWCRKETVDFLVWLQSSSHHRTAE